MKRRTKLVLAGVLLFIAVLILAFYGRSDRAMRFGTAGIGGVYYNFGQEFGDFLSDEGLKIDVKETAGSAANLRLLSGGFIQIAIAQTDVLNDAWTGTEMFDGKCDALVEAYRIVPEGSVWTRYDGVQFKGELISPADNYDTARFHQTQFEEDNENMMPLDDVAELVEMVYQDDIGVIG